MNYEMKIGCSKCGIYMNINIEAEWKSGEIELPIVNKFNCRCK